VQIPILAALLALVMSFNRSAQSCLYGMDKLSKVDCDFYFQFYRPLSTYFIQVQIMVLIRSLSSNIVCKFFSDLCGVLH